MKDNRLGSRLRCGFNLFGSDACGRIVAFAAPPQPTTPTATYKPTNANRSRVAPTLRPYPFSPVISTMILDNPPTGAVLLLTAPHGLAEVWRSPRTR